MKFCLCFLLLFSIFSAFPDEAAEYTGVIRNAAVSDSAQKGRIELYVFVNEEKVYPRTTVKGTRNFRIGDTFRFLYRSGDQVRVILCRKSFFRTTILLDAGTASHDALGELFNKTMKTKTAEVELGLAVPEGKYRVTLKRSFFAAEDAVACGGTVRGEDFKRRMADLLIRLQESPAKERARLLKQQSFRELARYAADSLEKLDHRITVRQNGRELFDSWKLGYRKTGRDVTWENVSFEIDWRAGDRIDVHFLDADLIDDDVVFKRFTNTPFSIQMLKGCIYGGILSNSGVIFSAEYLGISPAASGCSE